jgi:alpha-1,3-rhamnosyl/mannosyltransferase
VPVPPLEALVRCDVFHATNFLAPPAWHTPVVATVHDLSFVRHADTCLPPVRRLAELLPPVLRRAAAVVAVSGFTRDELAAWVPEVAGRTTVIPPGPHRRPPGDPADARLAPGPPHALLLGALNPRKNVALALDALAILTASGFELRLVLAGPESPLLDVHRLVADRGIDPSLVVVTGHVDDRQVAALLAGAVALAFPSRYEGFGMPLVEAMQAGVPVVAARAGATPETVADAALLVEPDDAEGFADALRAVATDGALRGRMVEAGRRRAQDFAWPVTASRTLELYRSVVGGG